MAGRLMICSCPLPDQPDKAALRPRLEKLASHAQGRSHRRTRDRVFVSYHLLLLLRRHQPPLSHPRAQPFHAGLEAVQDPLVGGARRAVRSLFVFILATAPTDPAVSSWNFTQVCRSEYDQ